MAELLILAPTAISAFGVGALLAGLSGPSACHWTNLDAMVLRRRLHLLKRRAPSRRQRWLGVCVLTGLIAVGGAIAFAAEPSAPEQLPKEVIGVVGSGEKLGLRIKAGEETRTLNLGDVYREDWTLTGLTAATATLSRNGQSQTIGLNPTGTLAQAQSDDPATSVRILTPANPDLKAQLDRARADQPAFNQRVQDQLGPWDGKTPRLGLSLAETQRYAAYQARAAAGQGPQGPNGFLSLSQIDALGADSADYLALNQKLLTALDAERGQAFVLYSKRPGGDAALTTPTAANGVVLSATGQDLMARNLSTVVLPNLAAADDLSSRLADTGAAAMPSPSDSSR